MGNRCTVHDMPCMCEQETRTERETMNMNWYPVHIFWEGMDDAINDAIRGTSEEDALKRAAISWPDATDIYLIEID